MRGNAHIIAAFQRKLPNTSLADGPRRCGRRCSRTLAGTIRSPTTS